jgi:hypothetical protein
MNFNYPKIQVLFKPCQSGKTKEFLKSIERTENDENEDNEVFQEVILLFFLKKYLQYY